MPFKFYRRGDIGLTEGVRDRDPEPQKKQASALLALGSSSSPLKTGSDQPSICLHQFPSTPRRDGAKHVLPTCSCSPPLPAHPLPRNAATSRCCFQDFCLLRKQPSGMHPGRFHCCISQLGTCKTKQEN